jgi:hypothetical protein
MTKKEAADQAIEIHGMIKDWWSVAPESVALQRRYFALMAYFTGRGARAPADDWDLESATREEERNGNG